jgi:hypothetical protein
MGTRNKIQTYHKEIKVFEGFISERKGATPNIFVGHFQLTFTLIF